MGRGNEQRQAAASRNARGVRVLRRASQRTVPVGGELLLCPFTGAAMSAIWQESVDRFYFRHGPCCAGCDWWRSISPLVGDCTKSKLVSGQERWDAIGIDKASLRLPAGHVITKRDHVCGNFKDEFDWTSLPLPYRQRVGDPSLKPTKR